MSAVLSIIVPVLDDAAALDALLRRLQPLRGAAVEVIVVDGGSRDGCDAVCAGRVDRFVASPAGRGAQMNAGAAVARGDALWFLHADSRLPDGAVALLQQALRSRAWGRFDIRIDGRSRWLPMVAAAMNLRSRLTGIATGDQGLFVRAAAFRPLGGFAELPLMEDIDFCRRAMRRLGRPACLRARIETSGRRWDRDGAWRTIVVMSWLRLRFWAGGDAHRLHALYYPQRGRREPRSTA